jgi:hypothetical protein
MAHLIKDGEGHYLLVGQLLEGVNVGFEFADKIKMSGLSFSPGVPCHHSPPHAATPPAVRTGGREHGREH